MDAKAEYISEYCFKKKMKKKKQTKKIWFGDQWVKLFGIDVFKKAIWFLCIGNDSTDIQFFVLWERHTIPFKFFKFSFPGIQQVPVAGSYCSL